MFPHLIGFAIFGAMMTWSNSLDREGKKSDPTETDPKPHPSPPPTSDYPRIWKAKIPDDPTQPENAAEIIKDPGPPVKNSQAVKRIAEALCTKALACPDFSSGLSWNDCVEDLQKDEYTSGKFGVSPHFSFQKMLEDGGLGYTAGANALERCAEDIQNLTCDQFGKKEMAVDQDVSEEKWDEKIYAEEAEPENEEMKLVGISVQFDSEEPSVCGDTFLPKPVTCDPSHSPVEINSSGIQTLVGALCTEMATCNPGLACEACFEGVMATHRFADKIGLNRLSFQAIDFGLGLGYYHFNEENLAQCLADIKKGNCPQAAGIWDAKLPRTPYGIDRVVPRDSESCARIFEKPKASCDSGTTDPLTRFAEALCGTVLTCRPEIPCDHCIEEVMASEFISKSLGANQDPKQWKAWQKGKQDLSLTGLRGFITQGRLVLDEAALEQCANDIDEQTCVKIQLGRGDYNPEGHRSLVLGVRRLFTDGTGSCSMAIHPPGFEE